MCMVFSRWWHAAAAASPLFCALHTRARTYTPLSLAQPVLSKVRQWCWRRWLRLGGGGDCTELEITLYAQKQSKRTQNERKRIKMHARTFIENNNNVFLYKQTAAVPCAIYHDDDNAILVHVLRVRPITKARVHVEGSERSPLYHPPARPSDCLSLSLSLRSLHTTRHTTVVERTPRKEFRLYPHYSLPSAAVPPPIFRTYPFDRSIYDYWLHNPIYTLKWYLWDRHQLRKLNTDIP